jgi:hypothetical protein
VGTRFVVSKPGRVLGFRFWRAEGETGANYGTLWDGSGRRLAVSNAFPSGSGWVTRLLSSPVQIQANSTYVVSVNTNAKQVKTGGGYVFEGHLSSGPLFSDGGYYGQPIFARPTQESASYFFVDVIFEEQVLKPDLIVAGINPYDGSFVRIQVCNVGPGDAGASATWLSHSATERPDFPDLLITETFVQTPAIAARRCVVVTQSSPSFLGYLHRYYANADSLRRIDESDERNAYLLMWDRR